MKKALTSVLMLVSFAALPVNAQSIEMRQQIAAMEMTLFGHAYCKDRPIRRIERLEENFMEPSKQKEKDLPTRIDSLLEKIKPSPELLSTADPCEGTTGAHFWTAASKQKAQSLGQPKGFMGMFAPAIQAENIRKYEYPYIEFAGVPWPGIDGGGVFLSTDFVPSGSSMGRLKYKILLKAQYAPRVLYITLLDQRGFKIGIFPVDGRSFEQSPNGKNNWVASESIFFSEKDYKQVRDFSAH